MRDKGGRNQSIVLVSSIRAYSSKPGRAVYASTKAAMNQMMHVMALELAPLGIRVNALLPGITATDLTMRNRQAFDEAIETVPLGRGGTPADMGRAVSYLVGDTAQFVTGVDLPVDGGNSSSDCQAPASSRQRKWRQQEPSRTAFASQLPA